jgi:uncharacterized CHY-type Zn-finger protein
MTVICPNCKKETVKIEYPNVTFCPLCMYEYWREDKDK